eukprot:scaffold84013_cov28-Tisochrysis_lutea.AAC.1
MLTAFGSIATAHSQQRMRGVSPIVGGRRRGDGVSGRGAALPAGGDGGEGGHEAGRLPRPPNQRTHPSFIHCCNSISQR